MCLHVGVACWNALLSVLVLSGHLPLSSTSNINWSAADQTQCSGWSGDDEGSEHLLGEVARAVLVHQIAEHDVLPCSEL
jgi:hypothetical protein